MAANHYGWFEQVPRGVYRLTAEGRDAMKSASSRNNLSLGVAEPLLSLWLSEMKWEIGERRR